MSHIKHYFISGIDEWADAPKLPSLTGGLDGHETPTVKGLTPGGDLEDVSVAAINADADEVRDKGYLNWLHSIPYSEKEVRVAAHYLVGCNQGSLKDHRDMAGAIAEAFPEVGNVEDISMSKVCASRHVFGFTIAFASCVITPDFKRVAALAKLGWSHGGPRDYSF